MGSLFIFGIILGLIFAVFLRYSSYLLTFIWGWFTLTVFYNAIKEFGFGGFFSNIWVDTIIYSTYEKYFSLFILILLAGIVYESYRKQTLRLQNSR